MGSAAGSRAILPPMGNIRRDQPGCPDPVLMLLDTCEQKCVPTHSHRHRLRVGMLYHAEAACSTALPAPPCQRAQLLARAQVIVMHPAGLAHCGQGCNYYAPEVVHRAAVCTGT